MRKYTQKVDAIQFTGTFESLKKIIKEFNIDDSVLIRSYKDSEIPEMVIGYWESDTGEGGLSVYKDDYLVRDAEGNLEKYNSSKFEKIFK